MVTLPEMKQEVFYHFLKAIALIEFLHDEEIEEVAHSLERAAGVTDLLDLQNCRVLAEIARSYAEERT